MVLGLNYHRSMQEATDLKRQMEQEGCGVHLYKANVAVPAEFLGKSTVTFALRYTATTKAGTWEVKNFVVAHGAATGETPEEPETPDTPDTPVVPSGDNLLVNGSFEDWSGNTPVGIGTRFPRKIRAFVAGYGGKLLSRR